MKAPKLCFHKASGRFFVYKNRKPDYFKRPKGITDKAYEKHAKKLYQEFVARLAIDQFAEIEIDHDTPVVYTCSNLALRYLAFAKRRYGKRSAEYNNTIHVLEFLNDQYGTLPLSKFDSIALENVRFAMIDSQRWCRRQINDQVKRLRKIFRWATEKKLVGDAVYGNLIALRPLSRAEGIAYKIREGKKVTSVDLETVKQTVTAVGTNTS